MGREEEVQRKERQGWVETMVQTLPVINTMARKCVLVNDLIQMIVLLVTDIY